MPTNKATPREIPALPEEILMLIFEYVLQDSDPERVCRNVECWLLGMGAASEWCRPNGVGSHNMWKRITKPLMYYNPTPLVPCILTGTHYERDGGWEHTSFRKAFVRISTTLHFWRDTLKHFNLKWYKRTLAAQCKVWEDEAHKRNWINRCVFEWRDRYSISTPIAIWRKMPIFQSTPNHMLYWKVHKENDSKLARHRKTEKYKEADKDLGDSIRGILHGVASFPSVVGVGLALKNGACPYEINALISAMRSYKTNGTKVSAEILDLIFKWPGMELRNDPWRFRNPLHWVIEEYPGSTPTESQRLIEVADKLIDAGLDVDAQNSDGDTPLLLLCRTKHVRGQFIARARRSVELMEHLIACGADINARDARWNTPLMVAIQCYNVRLAHALLDHGADVRMYNKDVLMSYNIATAAVQTASAPNAMADLAQRIDALHNAQNA